MLKCYILYVFIIWNFWNGKSIEMENRLEVVRGEGGGGRGREMVVIIKEWYRDFCGDGNVLDFDWCNWYM